MSEKAKPDIWNPVHQNFHLFLYNPSCSTESNIVTLPDLNSRFMEKTKMADDSFDYNIS